MRYFIPFLFFVFRLYASDARTPPCCVQREEADSLPLLYQTESMHRHELHQQDLQERIAFKHQYLKELYEKVDHIKRQTLWLDDDEIFYLDLSLKSILAYYFLHCVAIKKQEHCEESQLSITIKTLYELSMSVEKRRTCKIDDWNFHLCRVDESLQAAYLLVLLFAEHRLETNYRFPPASPHTFRVLGVHLLSKPIYQHLVECETLPHPVQDFLRSVFVELKNILNQIQRRIQLKIDTPHAYFNTIYNVFYPMYKKINWRHIKNPVVEEIFKAYMEIFHDMNICRYNIQKRELSKTSLPLTKTEISERDRYRYSLKDKPLMNDINPK